MKQEPPSGDDEAASFVKTEPLEGSGNEGDMSPGNMSLDVLAQVASDRLESEPRRRQRKEPVSLLQKKTKVCYTDYQVMEYGSSM